jgi:hypothetical protein
MQVKTSTRATNKGSRAPARPAVDRAALASRECVWYDGRSALENSRASGLAGHSQWKTNQSTARRATYGQSQGASASALRIHAARSPRAVQQAGAPQGATGRP